MEICTRLHQPHSRVALGLPGGKACVRRIRQYAGTSSTQASTGGVRLGGRGSAPSGSEFSIRFFTPLLPRSREAGQRTPCSRRRNEWRERLSRALGQPSAPERSERRSSRPLRSHRASPAQGLLRNSERNAPFRSRLQASNPSCPCHTMRGPHHSAPRGRVNPDQTCAGNPSLYPFAYQFWTYLVRRECLI